MKVPNPIKPGDLRGILEYVPMFRGQTFVIAIDGAIINDVNFANIPLDLAVLLNLHIRVVLVYGIGRQVKVLAEELGQEVENASGEGRISEEVLNLSVRAASQVGTKIGGALTAAGLTYAFTNAVRATETGIIQGVDFLHSGKVDRVDISLIDSLLEKGVVPVLAPIGFTRDGRPLRLNSDPLAVHLATALKASKLIFLTEQPGLLVDGVPVLNLPVAELRGRLERDPASIDSQMIGKARSALEAHSHGVPRCHLLDGRTIGALLTEVFDKVGLGTMIYSNEYQQIRPARKSDARGIFNMSRQAAKVEAIRVRTVEEIEASIELFFVYEVDDGMIGSAMLHPYPEIRAFELGAVFVQSYYEGRGVGRKLIEYAIQRARNEGAVYLFALSTQSFSFFTKICGFEEGTVDDLPEKRRTLYLEEGRQSKILINRLE